MLLYRSSASRYPFFCTNQRQPRAERTQRLSPAQREVTHARLLPVDSAHVFTYPTIAFLVSPDELERRQLDLGRGWVFGYGGRLRRLTGLRAAPYLAPGSGPIKQKLEGVLTLSGYPGGELRDAWMMTMPSFLGFEGINPLTVYFCYNLNGAFWLIVLEVS